MKKLGVVLCTLLLSLSAVAQSVRASAYANAWKSNLYVTTASGSGVTFTLDNCLYAVAGKNLYALAASPIMTIGAGLSTAETLAIASPAGPTATSGSPNGYTCTFTATSSNNHSAGEKVVFGDGGVAAAVKDVSSGMVILDQNYSSDTALASLTKGSYNVNLEDIRGPNAPAIYSWNGTAYASSHIPFSTVNGAQLVPFVNEELITLATGSVNSDSVANLLPANSIILSVVGKVQTAITGTCSSWTLADPTTAGRFAAANSTLTTAATSVGSVHATTGVASATTGLFQSAAAKVRIVCGTGNASAGKIRVTVFGYTIVPPAQ